MRHSSIPEDPWNRNLAPTLHVSLDVNIKLMRALVLSSSWLLRVGSSERTANCYLSLTVCVADLLSWLVIHIPSLFLCTIVLPKFLRSRLRPPRSSPVLELGFIFVLTPSLCAQGWSVCWTIWLIRTRMESSCYSTLFRLTSGGAGLEVNECCEYMQALFI